MTIWINNGVYTYIKLAPNVNEAQIEKQLPAFMEKYMGSDMRKYGFHFTLSLTPLKMYILMMPLLTVLNMAIKR